jgi:hypothetical protein
MVHSAGKNPANLRVLRAKSSDFLGKTAIFQSKTLAIWRVSAMLANTG